MSCAPTSTSPTTRPARRRGPPPEAPGAAPPRPAARRRRRAAARRRLARAAGGCDRARRENRSNRKGGEGGRRRGDGAPPPTPGTRLPWLPGHARSHPGARPPLPDAVPRARRRPAARGLAGAPHLAARGRSYRSNRLRLRPARRGRAAARRHHRHPRHGDGAAHGGGVPRARADRHPRDGGQMPDGRAPRGRPDRLGRVDRRRAGRRAALGHCVWIDSHAMDRLARQGTTVVHCPSSNLKLASGVAKIPELLAAGCRVAIGADGAPCNNGLDAFAEMRLAALIQKPRLGADALPAAQVLELATLGGARALGLEDEIGRIAPGKRADLVVLDLPQPHPPPPLPSDSGAALFAAWCKSCHGADGRGTAAATTRLEVPPADLHECKGSTAETEDRWVNIVARGGAAFGLSLDMPAFGE